MSLVITLVQNYHFEQEKNIPLLSWDVYEVPKDVASKVISRAIRIKMTNDWLKNERAFFARIASVDSQIANEIKKSGCKKVGYYVRDEALVGKNYKDGTSVDCALLPRCGIPVSLVSLETVTDNGKGGSKKLRYWLQVVVTAKISLEN